MRFSRTRLSDVVHRRHAVNPARPGEVWPHRPWPSGKACGADLEVCPGGSSQTALTNPFLHHNASTKQGPFPHRRFCCPLGSIGTMAPSDSLPAQVPFPGAAGYRVCRSSGPVDHRTGEGLTSSHRSLLNIPRPLRRRVLGGCFQALHRFHGLRHPRPGSALSWPTLRWTG